MSTAFDPKTKLSLLERLVLVAGWFFILVWLSNAALTWAWPAAVNLSLPYAAEALEHTGGLSRDTFQVSFWFVLIVLASAFVLSGVARLSGRIGSLMPSVLARPVLTTGLGFGVAAAVLLPLELNGSDLPDLLSTSATLGLLAYGLVLLPLALVVLLWRLGALGYGLASHNRTLAAVVTGLALVLAIASPSPADLEVPSQGLQLCESYSPPVRAFSRSSDVATGSLAALSTVAGEFELNGNNDLVRTYEDALEVGKQRFNACIEELVSPTTRKSTVEAAIDRLQWKCDSRATAEDVAYATVTKVCEKHMEDPKDHLAMYYNRAVDNNAKYEWRKYRNLCPLECAEHECTYDPDAMRVRDARRAFCSLEPDEKKLLVLRLDGTSFKEIAAELGIDTAAARKRYSRIINKLQERFAH